MSAEEPRSNAMASAAVGESGLPSKAMTKGFSAVGRFARGADCVFVPGLRDGETMVSEGAGRSLSGEHSRRAGLADRARAGEARRRAGAYGVGADASTPGAGGADGGGVKPSLRHLHGTWGRVSVGGHESDVVVDSRERRAASNRPRPET